MIIFKGQTFCASDDCQNTKCDKRLSLELYKEAGKEGLPISVMPYQQNCDDYDPKGVCDEVYGDCS